MPNIMVANGRSLQDVLLNVPSQLSNVATVHDSLVAQGRPTALDAAFNIELSRTGLSSLTMGSSNLAPNPLQLCTRTSHLDREQILRGSAMILDNNSMSRLYREQIMRASAMRQLQENNDIARVRHAMAFQRALATLEVAPGSSQREASASLQSITTNSQRVASATLESRTANNQQMVGATVQGVSGSPQQMVEGSLQGMSENSQRVVGGSLLNIAGNSQHLVGGALQGTSGHSQRSTGVDSNLQRQPRPQQEAFPPDSRGVSRRPVVLYLSCDESSLTPYQCVARKQIELFEASQGDIEAGTQGRARSITLGRVGIRCRHCSHLPFRDRTRASTYFPSKLAGLYQAAQNMTNSHLTQQCKHVPKEIRDELLKLGNKKSAAGAGKDYWSASAKILGVVEAEDGLRFEQRRLS